MNRIDILQKMHTDNPTEGFVLFALAKEYENQGAASEALDYYTKLRAADPNYVGLYYHFGQLLSRTGAHDAAVEVLDAGIEIAQKLKDRHSLAELMELRMGYDIDNE